VLTLDIANHKIRRILIDTWSSADILYKTTFELMKIDAGTSIPFESIELPVVSGTYPRKETIMVKLMVIDPSGFNAILRRRH
jgi:hypothetical protein